MKRRAFLKGATAGGAISVLDWLGWFESFGVPGSRKTLGIGEAAAQAAAGEPRFLIYWFQEGGWDSYSMFGAVDTPNHATLNVSSGELHPSPEWSDHFYRPTGYPSTTQWPSKKVGNITTGYLGQDGLSLFPDLAVLSSHDGHPSHSSGRLFYHYGKYNLNGSSQRGTNERSVMQAFCERYGQAYPMAHLSWHRWLSDGELSEPSYPEGTGYYDNAGPAWAHTNYGRTPADLRSRLQGLSGLGVSARNARMRSFVDHLHDRFVADTHGESVRAFASAVQLHRSLTGGSGAVVNPATMFTDPTLRADFNISASDEQTTATVVNGNPARSKNSPNTNVQAMMAYEMITKGLSVGCWIESREVRGFDDHRSRGTVMSRQGQQDQRGDMAANLWSPLKTLVAKLKATPYGTSGKSYWDYTTIMLASEMGRSMFGDVRGVLSNGNSAASQYSDIMEQDVSQHWAVNSCAFLGGTVAGNRQFGKVGTSTLTGIPIEPSTGALDPAFDATTGRLISGRTQSPTSLVPDYGSLFATALHLSGFSVGANGRIVGAAGQSVGANESAPLTFFKK